MLTVTGSVDRTFEFPADPKTTVTYYHNLKRLVAYLPHITLLHAYHDNHISLKYEAEELQAYTIIIYCDLHARIDADTNHLLIRPVRPENPVPAEATLSATQGQGLFAMETKFTAIAAELTRIDYTLQLQAKLPRPRGMRLMPRRIVNRITDQITNGRVLEIADGFITQSIAAFPAWQAANPTAGQPA